MLTTRKIVCSLRRLKRVEILFSYFRLLSILVNLLRLPVSFAIMFSPLFHASSSSTGRGTGCSCWVRQRARQGFDRWATVDEPITQKHQQPCIICCREPAWRGERRGACTGNAGPVPESIYRACLQFQRPQNVNGTDCTITSKHLLRSPVTDVLPTLQIISVRYIQSVPYIRSCGQTDRWIKMPFGIRR